MNSKSVAFHEAGHAFVAWKLGHKLKKATIVPTEEYGGMVESRSGLHLRSLEWSNPSGARIGKLHERLVGSLAGIAAQRRRSPQSIRSYHGSSDYKFVKDVLYRIHAENEVRHVLKYLEARAENVVERHWGEISHLAEALERKRTMSGDEIAATIRAWYQAQIPPIDAKEFVITSSR